MKRIAAVLGAQLMIAGLAAQTPAQEKWIGVWKLDRAKSGAGAPASSVTTIEAIRGGVRVTSETTNAAGATNRTEYSAQYGGGEVPVTGSQGATASVVRIDDNTIEVTTSSQGAITVARNVISGDGKTRTVTQTLTIGNRKSQLQLVYARQP
jgi:hypothetical protein